MPLLRHRKLDRAAKDAYWLVVRDCLADLFDVPPADAQCLADGQRAYIESAPKNARHDITYHADPFEVAESLAHAPGLTRKAPVPTLDDPQSIADYEAILARHGFL